MTLRQTTEGNLEVQDPSSGGWVPLQSVVTPADGLPVVLNPAQQLILTSIQSLLSIIQESTSALQTLAASIRDIEVSSNEAIADVNEELDLIKTEVQSIKSAVLQQQRGTLSLTRVTLSTVGVAQSVTIPSSAKSFAIGCRGYDSDVTGDVWIAMTSAAAIAGGDGANCAKMIPDGTEYYQDNLNLPGNLTFHLAPATAGTVVVIEVWS